MARSLLRKKAAVGRTEQDCQLVKVARVIGSCVCVCESPDEEDLGKDLRWLVGGLLVGQQSAQMQLFQ